MEPLDLLLEDLWNFYKRMKNYPQDENMAERFIYFRDHSTSGVDCKYARGCKKIFLERDRAELREMFLECLSSWRKLEGEDFGR